jgi:hypothetical protein
MALPTASDNEFPKLILEEVANDGSATVTPAADHRALFLGEDGFLHAKDSAGSVTDPYDAAGSGTTTNGNTLFAFPPGFGVVATGTSALVASAAYMGPIVVPAPMLVRGFTAQVSTAGSGTHQWGLFKYSASATAATKLAGGSGALNSTGEVSIAATGAPVTIEAGAYMLIVHAPAANAATIRSITATVASKLAQQAQTSYAWDDTPDLTSGWGGAASTIRMWYLTGDLLSGAQF